MFGVDAAVGVEVNDLSKLSQMATPRFSSRWRSSVAFSPDILGGSSFSEPTLALAWFFVPGDRTDPVGSTINFKTEGFIPPPWTDSLSF